MKTKNCFWNVINKFGLFAGIGYAVVLIAFYVDFYYNVIIAWSLRYFFASFSGMLPWTTCDNPWNTPMCREFNINVSFADAIAISPVLPNGNQSAIDLIEGLEDASRDFAIDNNSQNNNTLYTSAAQEYFKWDISTHVQFKKNLQTRIKLFIRFLKYIILIVLKAVQYWNFIKVADFTISVALNGTLLCAY